ncbi:MAG: GNAT family N-acetyltransferase [Cyanobacteria bacterium J06633_23]
MQIVYSDHLPADLKSSASALLLSAFREKLLPVLGDDERAQHVVEESINSTNCIAAIDDQKLVGLLGVRNDQGLFFRPTLKLMTTAYGVVGGLLRKACLALLEHATAPDEWYVFCVAVSEEARGQGIGSHLFARLEERAIQNGATKISLQVINTNPRAKVLYERLGFVSRKQTPIWPFNRLVGWPFESAVLMVKEIG